jgi:hypothetical protein
MLGCQGASLGASLASPAAAGSAGGREEVLAA